MKTKIKRHSRSVLSVVLSLCMLVSCMTVGLIATDAAKTSGGENVSAKAVDEATAGAKVADEATVGAKTADEDTVGAQATDEATVGANAADEDTVGANVADEETVGAIAADESSVGAINTSGLMFRIWKKGSSTAEAETPLSAKDVYYDVITTGASKELWGFQLKDGDKKFYDNGENLAEEADIGNGKNFLWMNNTTPRGERNVYLDASSTYQVCYKQVDDGGGKILINIRKKITTATGWYLVGGHDWGDWSTSNTSYPFTSSGNYYEREITVTKNTYFRVHNGVSQYNCSDTSDTTLTVSDDWSSLSVGSAKALMVAAGTYKIQIDNTNTKIRLQSVAPTQSRLTVDTTNDAVVTATYNGVTKGEGEYFEDVPQGAVISVSVVPDSAKKCTGITSTGGGTITGSGNSYTLTMPAAVTTVTATITDVTLRSIYFNNGNTLYSMVFAYVEDAAGYKYLGAYPGKAMTKLSNSNIWEIQVPDDSTTVIFRGTNNANTGTMTIPWSTTNNKPKYTPPYGQNDAPTIGKGGTWGEYKSRTNEITVTDGANMNRRGIFTGINATFYDYYVDNEVDGTWRTSINSSSSPYDYSKGNGSQYLWNPYTKLNDELSRYAEARSVSYPLYFGNLNLSTYTGGKLDFSNVGHGDQAAVEDYHNWAASTKANNSVYLGNGNDSKAVTGLTGKTLANSTIHYYSASDTENENGVAMAMFDEDFLSGENNSRKNLATILRSNSFPVRKLYEGESATITYENKIYVDAGGFQVQGADNGADGKLWAHFSDGGSGDKLMTYDSVSGYYICDIPSDCTKVTFVRTKAAATGVVWESDNNFWNKSDTYDVETSTSSASRLYTFTNYDNKIGKFSKGSIGTEYGATFSGGHTYYKFDSQYGKDNAYITDVSGTTAQLSYYSDKDGKFVHAAKVGDDNDNGDKGFFPFDYDQASSGNGGLAHDLGFGMKLEIPFTLNLNGLNEDNTAQTFDFSGDDDLWVFIDNKLILDLGGAHSRTTGTINFNTKKITGTSTDNVGNSVSRNGDFEIGTTENDVNTVHTMTIYYMERGMYDSNLMFGFSFHAVPDMLMVDKKVRTYDVNSGFFTANTNTTAYDTNNQVVKNDKGDPITQFEYTYQAALALEPFGITQKSSQAPVNGGITYTIDSVPTTIAEGDLGSDYSFVYNLYNDQVAYFASQIPLNTSGSAASTVTLAETIPNNSKYKYTTDFSVTNIANGNSAIAFTENNGEYTFAMPEGSTTGLNDIRVSARFTNHMITHDLNITKEISNAYDANADFTFEIKFKFGNYGYVPYVLDCTVDGASRTLDENGQITVKAGQLIKIPNIPENAQIQITEIVPQDFAYESITAKNADGTDLSDTPTTVASGIQFVMGSKNINAVVSNTKDLYRYVIEYQYNSRMFRSTDGSNSLQSYIVSGTFTDEEMAYLNTERTGFKSDDNVSKKTFLYSKNPYEDNFREEMRWNCAAATVSVSEKTFNIVVQTTNQTDNKIVLKVVMPFEATLTNEGTATAAFTPTLDSTDSKIHYSEAAYQKENIQLAYMEGKYITENEVTPLSYTKSRFSINGQQNKVSDELYIKAPESIWQYNSTSGKWDIQKYFSYWSIKNTNGDEYLRNYSQDLNTAFYINSTATAVYAFDTKEQFDSRMPKTNDKTAKIELLEQSRNQWNDKIGSAPAAWTAADRLISDYLLTFSYNGKTINKLTGMQYGVLFEKVGSLTSDGSGGYHTDKSSYSDAFTQEAITTAKTNAESFLKTYNVSNGNYLLSLKSSTAKIDNKNQIEYSYSIKNSDSEKQYEKSYFRVYAFLRTSDKSEVVLSDPIFLAMYDVASIENGNNNMKIS